MFARPTEHEVAYLAETYGLRLSTQEVAQFVDLLTAQLDNVDTFLNARLDDGPPPLVPTHRAAGRRPTVDEDPYGAWQWLCDISTGGDGLLAGKTVAFKDHIAVAGIPTSWGTRALEGVVSPLDAAVVRKVLNSGGTVVGKTTHHGFGGLSSMNGGLGDYWDAVNPHDSDLQTGGSSSGSAVAVAAGQVDIAFGGDQGGSIRQPAAYCEVVGMKPTFGLVSHAGAFYGGEPSVDHVGPIGRSVHDVALALQAVLGYDASGGDPRQGREIPDELDVLSGLEQGVAGLRIGVLKEGFALADPDVATSVHVGLDRLVDQGAVLVEVSVPEHVTVGGPAGVLQLAGMRTTRLGGAFTTALDTHVPTTVAAAINTAWTHHGGEMAAFVKLTWLFGELAHRRFDGTAYIKAHNVRPAFRRAYDRAFADVDVLAMPTCPQPTPHRTPQTSWADRAARELGVLGEVMPSYANLQPFNYTGHPAIAVPTDRVGAAPCSVQIVGPHLADGLVVQVAHALTSGRTFSVDKISI